MEAAELNFLVSVLAIRSGELSDDAATEGVRKAILRLGSRTADNLAAARRIGVGSVPHCVGNARVHGVCLKKLPALISDIMSYAEDAEVPSCVAEVYPELTQKDWAACIRYVILLLTLFERKVSTPEKHAGSGRSRRRRKA